MNNDCKYSATASKGHAAHYGIAVTNGVPEIFDNQDEEPESQNHSDDSAIGKNLQVVVVSLGND
jgi:hypothetical protein